MLAASSGLRPLKTAPGRSRARPGWRRRCPAGMPSGTVRTRPTTPARARPSMYGVRAASSGVRPPSSAAARRPCRPAPAAGASWACRPAPRVTPSHRAAEHQHRQPFESVVPRAIALCRSSAPRPRPSWSRRPPRSARCRSAVADVDQSAGRCRRGSRSSARLPKAIGTIESSGVGVAAAHQVAEPLVDDVDPAPVVVLRGDLLEAIGDAIADAAQLLVAVCVGLVALEDHLRHAAHLRALGDQDDA